jgi:intergrase/recombinase
LLKRATLKRCDDATRLYRMLMLFVNEEVIDATQAQRLLKIVKEDPSKLLQIQQKLAAHMAVKDGAPNS